ncbi:MAG: ABC-type transport auxiliary lipoprotein family protein [Candidatus Sulfotelmatobacter sp.]
MNRNLAVAVVTLLALAVLSGCSGKMGRANYYTLNLPAPPDPPAAEKANATVAIREFRAPAYLRQGPIVYKPSPEQIGFYAYHRWATDPCEFVTQSIIARLGATGTFSHVKHYDGQPDAGYVVSGRLEKLEEIDYEGGVKVEVAVSAQMTRVDTGTIVWSKAVSEVGEVNQHDVPAVVSEMSHTMERAIEKLLTPVPGTLTAVSKAAAN